MGKKEKEKWFLAEYKRFADRIDRTIGPKQICESKVIGFLVRENYSNTYRTTEENKKSQPP